MTFTSNIALRHGGAIHLSDHCTATFENSSNVTFYQNTADGYGGAMYSRFIQSRIFVNSKFYSHFFKNKAKLAGNSLHIAVPKSCNSTCIENGIIDATNTSLKNSESSKLINTTPSKIILYPPAVCIDTKADCKVYYIDNIRLGQEIITGACVLDYYDQPTNAVQFVVSGENNTDYHINGVHDILISCGNNTLRGITIFGNKAILHTFINYSMTIAFHTNAFDEFTFSIKLIVGISPCYPGFKHSDELQRCACYDNTDVVFCIGSNSTIKRGYWFGIVNGQPTVTVCPVNYCDFTCCETTDGFYHFSPLRTNQCRPHRSGSACGSCEEGWTLSFDSAKCVSIEQCTAGQTVLVVTLTILYWIAVVTAVFALMYFKVPIGYLYSISFYYSMMDVMMNRISNYSQSLFFLLKIISSIFNVVPGFLGRLCLVSGMSGIDQQVIHYVHPIAIFVILTLLKLLAAISCKLSLSIRRRINHVSCIILLLSYTSIASSSLLLIKTLTFYDVDKTYTYLSPDIEYFHGRHLPYTIVAVLCMIVIVIGLPLLLLLEPFLNHKINFYRIQLFLDLFQGCYKDNYHFVAAYYFICRLVLLIATATSSDNFLSQSIKVSSCIIIAGVHSTIRPYNCKWLNTFDEWILRLMILVAILFVYDKPDSELVVGISFACVILPLLTLLAMILSLHKVKIKRAYTCCHLSNNTNNTDNNTDTPMVEVSIVVDDGTRKNAYICDV